MASLKFDIPSTTVKVNVELWRTLQGVTIDALNSYVGEPLNGYQVGKITSTPEKINIIGSDEALQKFTVNGNKLTIPASEDRDITGKSADCEFSVDLAELLPKDIKLASGVNDTALIKVSILPLNSKEYNISTTDIKIENNPGNMNVVLDKVEVLVRVEGLTEELDKLEKSQIHLSIDLKGYTEAGEYEVPVKIEVPDGYQVVDEVKVKATLTNTNTDAVAQKPAS
nr:CdaR family protein [Blautia sp. NSJ-165]